VADQKTQIDFIEVKAEDVMAERQGLYDGFMRSIPWIVGGLTGSLVLIYLLWG
jgi:uncharacterized membrane protein